MSGLRLVVMIREEEVSAAKLLSNRPGGQQMSIALTSRDVKQVLSLKLDRLFQDAVDALNQTRAWDRAGIALHLVREWTRSILRSACTDA